MAKEVTASGEMGFCGLLTIVFIVLKLIDIISWSWWWVLSPLWIPVGVAIVVAIIGVIILAIRELWR